MTPTTITDFTQPPPHRPEASGANGWRLMLAMAALAMTMLASCGRAPPTAPGVTTQAPRSGIENPAPAEGDGALAEQMRQAIEPVHRESPASADSTTLDGGKLIEETWEAYTMQGSRV